MKKPTPTLSIALLLVLSLAGPLRARDFYVDNHIGEDSFDGSEPLVRGSSTGPLRTIGRAIRLASKGDRVILADTGVPYRESLTLQAGPNSGLEQRPFELVGNGAVLEGAAPIHPSVWEPAGDGIFRFAPPRTSYQLLFLDGRPAERVAVEPADLQLPPLQPLQWCLFQRQLYFRPEPGKLPDDYPLDYSALPVGITLYEVRRVVIRDLIIQGFQLDGINAHDSVFGATLSGVVCRGNARSGISVGGASRVQIEDSTLGSNGAAQLRTEGYSHTRVTGSQLLDDTAPALVRDGGRVQID